MILFIHDLLFIFVIDTSIQRQEPNKAIAFYCEDGNANKEQTE